ncbi:MAG: rubrerythrin family protein [Spirochaetales bacterium]|nr:rubrerythrin family protein [Spirochaetales bacterium]
MSKNYSRNLSGNARAVIFSNLAKASEKQMDSPKAVEFSRLSEESWCKSTSDDGLEVLMKRMEESLAGDYPGIQKDAEALGDRGVQRALKWGQKVTMLQKTLIGRFLSGGESIMDNKDLYICEACGFIFLGAEVPAQCPVCKAPETRFSKIK